MARRMVPEADSAAQSDDASLMELPLPAAWRLPSRTTAGELLDELTSRSHVLEYADSVRAPAGECAVEEAVLGLSSDIGMHRQQYVGPKMDVNDNIEDTEALAKTDATPRLRRRRYTS